MTSRSHLGQLPANSRPNEIRLWWHLSRWILNLSLQRGRDIPQLPGHLSTFMVRKFSFCLIASLCSFLCLLPLSCCCALLRRIWLPVPPDQGGIDCKKDILWVFCLPGLTDPFLSASSSIMFFSPLKHLGLAPLTRLTPVWISVLYWRDQYWMFYPRQVSQVPNRGNDHFSQLVVTRIQPWLKPPKLLWSKDRLLIDVNLSTRAFSFFLQSCFPEIWLQPVWVVRGHSIPDAGICICFCCLTPQVPVSPFPQAVQVPLMGCPDITMLTAPPNAVLSANLARAHSVPSSKSLMKTLVLIPALIPEGHQ